MANPKTAPGIAAAVARPGPGAHPQPAATLREALVSYGVPDELVQQREKGLMALSLGLPGVLVIVWSVFKVAGPFEWVDRYNLLSALLMALSLAVALIFRSKRLSLRARLGICEVYAILVSLGITALENIVSWPRDGIPRGVSWVGLWIILLAVLVPSKPVRTFVIGFLCASTGPLAIAITVALGRPSPAFWTGATLVGPTYAAVLCATIAAVLIHKLGTGVSRARQLGNYELGERLGAGGMGEVWRARHRLLGRQAAVKLVRSDLPASENGADRTTKMLRFEREAKATALLRSPHTVQLYDFGAAPDGTLYYVMELLDGIDLESLVHGFGALPLGRVAFVGRQICRSLAEAHHEQLVHRDIKPANIFVCKLGTEWDFVKVLDFGLARPAHSANAHWQKLTQEGWVGGTPAFMAPEAVLQGSSIDHRADIYGLGCILYWMLTGKLVFEVDTPLAMVRHHLRMPPVPPSQRGATGLPAPVEQLVLQCLAKDPSERPRDVQAIADALAPYERSWTAEQARAWWEANGAAVATLKSESSDTTPASVDIAEAAAQQN